MSGCSVPECPGERYCRGWCRRHYRCWERHGDPLHPMVIIGDDRARFESRVDRSGGPDACHPWTGPLTALGYAITWLAGKNRFAHTVAWEFANGPLPLDPGTGRRADVDHECHNQAVREGTCRPGICAHRSCCNERHLVVRATRLEHVIAGEPFPRVRGSAHALAKLTEDDVRLIRERLAAGELGKDLAPQFGVTASTISVIKRGIGWRHV